jgi:hypothetical protein
MFFLASTQTITNSYDDQEPAQPMKVWNKSNDTNSSCFHSRKSIFLIRISSDSTDVTPKQNGINDSPNKSSSSSVLHPPSSSTANNEDDDKNLIISSTPLPAAVPLIIEPKELNTDEVVSSPQTSKEMEDTPPSVNEQMITENPKVVEEDENITDNTTNQDIVKEPPVEEQMDTDQTNGRD